MNRTGNPLLSKSLLGLGAFLILVASANADWPAFRGPDRDGVVRSKTTLPVRWASSEGLAWRTEIPGEGWSSPVIVGKQIFLTTAVPLTEGGYDLRLIGVDAVTGQVNIQTRLFDEGPDAPKIHKKNSHASPTPVFDGKHLFVHFGHQGTACVDLNGVVQWKNDSLGYSPVHGNGGSPTIVDDLLIFSRDGAEIAEITAINKNDGTLVWQSERQVEARKKFSFCTPLLVTIDGRRQLILPGSNVVQSLNPSTGEEYWRLRYEGYSVIPRPIYHQGLVFVCTGYDRPQLLAIDPTGNGDVTETHLRWESQDNIPHTPSLIGRGDDIYMISDRGVASALDAKSGELRWRERIGGNFSASPLLAGSLLYLLSESGECTVLDIREEPKTVAENSIGERCLASFAALDGDLILRSADALYRIH